MCKISSLDILIIFTYKCLHYLMFSVHLLDIFQIVSFYYVPRKQIKDNIFLFLFHLFFLLSCSFEIISKICHDNRKQLKKIKNYFSYLYSIHKRNYSNQIFISIFVLFFWIFLLYTPEDTALYFNIFPPEELISSHQRVTLPPPKHETLARNSILFLIPHYFLFCEH